MTDKKIKVDYAMVLTAKNFRQLEKSKMTVGDLKKAFARRKKGVK